ncbi:MAG TPA: SPOCS domain-containing protein [Clostridia bacterium]|nr:SPOCS domain-containing protein [Clostridia bacterium]
MDLSLTRDTVRISEPVFETAADHPIECDIILPDYCPDIARILKSEANVCIDSKSVDGGRLTIGGNFTVKIIYIPENSGVIRCISHDQAFSAQFEAGQAEPEAYVKAKARVVYVNCRPVGPRRVQVKASVGISAKIWCRKEEEFVSGAEDQNAEMLRKQMKACSLVGAADRDFKLSDELEVGYGKPEIAAVIKSDAVAVVQDYKVISNKIILKGEVMLHTIYSTDQDGGEMREDEEQENTPRPKLEMMEHTIPISQIIDLEGADEDCICDVGLMAGALKVEAASDEDGESRVLAVEMDLTATVRAYKMQEFFIVTDAYCPDYDMDLKTRQLSFEQIVDTVKATEMIRESVDIAGMDVASITDCTVKADIDNVSLEGKVLNISGSLNASFLAEDSQSGPSGFEKAIPFRIREELKEAAEVMRCEPNITVVSTGYSMNGLDKIDLRVECMVEAMIFGVSSETAVTDMNVDDSRPKECGNKKALTLYYADEGEKIWDIAKKYSTSMDAIKRENGMEEDRLNARRMLLIPKKKCGRTE